MYIRLGYDIEFGLTAPTPLLALLYTHPSVSHWLRTPDELQVTPDIPVEKYTDVFGNHAARLLAPTGPFRLFNDLVVEMEPTPDPVKLDAVQHNVEDLPLDTLQFLLNSRYCEVDKLNDIAWKLFGNVPPGWGKVQAVCDWVHQHITFGYPFASPTKTAFDVYEEGRGVCRDYQHLALTFCRCMNIPARYATGWLGDHFVPPIQGPMDFSAWFQVYLDGQWWDFDARFNTPRVGRVLMATGRDAADCALTTAFGSAPLNKFLVWSDRIESAQIPDTPPNTHTD